MSRSFTLVLPQRVDLEGRDAEDVPLGATWPLSLWGALTDAWAFVWPAVHWIIYIILALVAIGCVLSLLDRRARIERWWQLTIGYRIRNYFDSL